MFPTSQELGSPAPSIESAGTGDEMRGGLAHLKARMARTCRQSGGDVYVSVCGHTYVDSFIYMHRITHTYMHVDITAYVKTSTERQVKKQRESESESESERERAREQERESERPSYFVPRPRSSQLQGSGSLCRSVQPPEEQPIKPHIPR